MPRDVPVGTNEARGQTRPLAITLDSGPLDAAAPLVLAATGWLQYGDAGMERGRLTNALRR